MLLNARKKILLADSSKLGNVSFAKFGDLSSIDILITDAYADPKMIEADPRGRGGG